MKYLLVIFLLWIDQPNMQYIPIDDDRVTCEKVGSSIMEMLNSPDDDVKGMEIKRIITVIRWTCIKVH